MNRSVLLIGLLFAGTAAPATASAASAAGAKYLADIPADTPYVFATLKPFPPEISDMFVSGVGVFDTIFDNILKEGKGKNAKDPEADRVARAVALEVKGKLNRKGLEGLGISTSPQFAVYGLGPMPIIRLQIASGKKLRAAIDRVMKNAKVKAPRKKFKSVEYWELDGFVVSVLEDTVVIGIGSEAALPKMLPFVLGLEKVPNPMLDGKPLLDLIARYKFTDFAVGYVESANIVKGMSGQLKGVTGDFWALLSQGAWQKLAPACRSEVEAMARRFPRGVVGYTQLDRSAMSGLFMFEIEPSLSSALAAAVAEIPGFNPTALGQARIAFGAALKIDAARKLGERLASGLQTVGRACNENDMTQSGQKFSSFLKEQLPPSVENTRGVYAVGVDFDVSGEMPKDINAYIVAQTKDPKAVLAQLNGLAQGQVNLQVPGDGKFHKLTAAMLDPFTAGAYLAHDQRHIFLATGPRGKAAAEKVQSSKPTASPFFLFAYDPAYLMGKLASKMQDREADLVKTMANMYKGPVAMWAHSAAQGLALSFRWSFLPAPR